VLDVGQGRDGGLGNVTVDLVGGQTGKKRNQRRVLCLGQTIDGRLAQHPRMLAGRDLPQHLDHPRIAVPPQGLDGLLTDTPRLIGTHDLDELVGGARGLDILEDAHDVGPQALVSRSVEALVQHLQGTLIANLGQRGEHCEQVIVRLGLIEALDALQELGVSLS